MSAGCNPCNFSMQVTLLILHEEKPDSDTKKHRGEHLAVRILFTPMVSCLASGDATGILCVSNDATNERRKFVEDHFCVQCRHPRPCGCHWLYSDFLLKWYKHRES